MTNSKPNKLRERLYWIGDTLIMGSIMFSLITASVYYIGRLRVECVLCNAFYTVILADLIVLTIIVSSAIGVAGMIINYYASFSKRFKAIEEKEE